MFLPTAYIEERVIERGILMVSAPSKVSSDLQHEDLVGAARRKVFESVYGILRPALAEAVDATDLTVRIDRLLSNDILFAHYADLSVGLGAVGAVALGRGPGFPRLRASVGPACEEEVALRVRENAKAVFGILQHALVQAPGEPLPEASVSAEVLLKPSLYMSTREIPPAVQRALLGRDIGQIALTGVLKAQEWGLTSDRTLDLCERFITNQSLWLELLNTLSGASVAHAALPRQATDFEAAVRTSQAANEAFDQVTEVLDSAKETIYFRGEL